MSKDQETAYSKTLVEFTAPGKPPLWVAGNGRISTVAKGARRPKSPFAGKLDLFYEADFSYSGWEAGDCPISSLAKA